MTGSLGAANGFVGRALIRVAALTIEAWRHKESEVAVEVCREWRGGFSTRRPPRPWSYFQQRRQADDLSTRHDPATAISDRARWYDYIDEPISVIVVPLLLVLAGLIRTSCHYVLVFLRIVVDRRAVIVVERDGQVIERHEVVGRLEGVRLARQLRSRHRGPEARR